ncbi:MAG: hypothetical protein ABEJ23_07710 [Haloarculaceae archaeon]
MHDNEHDAGTDAQRRSRRTFLAVAGGAGAALLAGCADKLPTGGRSNGTGTDPATEMTRPAGDHEADVVGLMLHGSESDLAFEVTVQNRGEMGYVDWWQVEPADDTVGNDDPIHRQETQVTDSETTTTPVGAIDADVVVVRAHHSVGGYGGQAVVARPAEGRLGVAWQGAEPAPQGDFSFDAES